MSGGIYSEHGYYARCADLLEHLRTRHGLGLVHVETLHDELGWSSHELRAKLMQLRRDGVVEYDRREQAWRVA